MYQMHCFSEKKSFKEKIKVGFVGVGCYGTALAQSFCSNNIDVVLVSDSKDVCDSINNNHVHFKALPEVHLSPSLLCSTSYDSLSDVDAIFITTPAKSAVQVCKDVSHFNVPLILCSKGLDPDSGRLLSDAIMRSVKNDILVFSGPSFAVEVANGQYAAVNLAGKNQQLAIELSKRITSEKLNVIPISDYIGLQVFGIFKNVLAVVGGVLRGLDAGNSAIASMLTLGVQDVLQLNNFFGGNDETFFEVGGFGDTLLTCTSEKSRNVLFGEFCAKNPADKWVGALAEGALTAKWIPVLEERYSIKLPVLNKIYSIIYEKCSAEKLLSDIEIVARL